jgi:hypothetical protein
LGPGGNGGDGADGAAGGDGGGGGGGGAAGTGGTALGGSIYVASGQFVLGTGTTYFGTVNAGAGGASGGRGAAGTGGNGGSGGSGGIAGVGETAGKAGAAGTKGDKGMAGDQGDAGAMGLSGVTSGADSYPALSTSPPSLQFKNAPASGTAGTKLSPKIVVDVDDVGGNVLAGDTPVVTLKIKSGPAGGAIVGTASITAVKGVATFSDIAFDVSGSYKLKATAAGFTTGKSGTIAINPAAANHLAFAVEPPPTVTHHVAISPAMVVDVEDGFGNIVVTDDSDVTLSIKLGTSGAILHGVFMVAADDGVATFSDVLLNQTGIYKLTADDGTLAGANSVKFTVT